MTEQQLLQQALAGLSLSPNKLQQPDQGQPQGEAQGQALLKLLQGHNHGQQQQRNGYAAAVSPTLLAAPCGGGGPLVPGPEEQAAAMPPPAQEELNGMVPSQPEQAVSSLFGAGGGSIWSSQLGGGGSSGGDSGLVPGQLAGSLWGVSSAGWLAQHLPPPAPVQQQQQPEALGHYQQLQRQAAPQPPYQPLQFAPKQHLPPPQHPALRSQQLGMPPPSLLPQQQQMLTPQQLQAQHPPYMHQQPGLPQQQQLPLHLQHLQQQYAPPAAQQPAQPRPVMPYNPLAALLEQPGSMRPPQHLQQQQPPTTLGMQTGAWGPGALFGSLPAMQHLQQQQLGSLEGSSMSTGHAGPFPPLSPHTQAAPQQQQQQQPPGPPGLFGSMLRAAPTHPPSALSTASPSPPLPPQHDEGGAQGRQERPAASARQPGTQHATKLGPGRENRWVDVMDRRHDGRQPKADMQQLDAALTQLADSLMPTPEENAAQLDAFGAVKSLLQARYPGARVHLFGSVANGLSVRHNNDIDVCLELEGVDDQAGKSEVAVSVGELMEAAGMSEVLPLPKARVPVVKFVVPRTGTKVDVTVNNLLACVNTKLLADYCSIDPRLAPLVALVKHWAKQRAVNDPYRGTLSSYCYVLMCIHLLQMRPTPVLPVLQQLPPTFRRSVGPWTCEFCDDVEALRSFGSPNHENLAQLVWAFFEYWAWRHNYSHDVISVRLGACLHKDDKDWTRRIGNERHLVCIEDPFELSHDLGRTVDRQTRAVLHKEFTRAATLLRDADDPLDLLFAQYRVGHRG